ncbi:glutamate--tRNA ligase [Nitrospirillum viridazoti]|uniref:Glutamate--tRNA ligase n=2 Tax=Nitrospirillum TaxID=1543705 RepID=A0A560IX45_9PROT|nr:glutamate--tRNA ligase [Nitrospirillum amazonense]TWB63613.1 glutamyl-tRNA synthetase [Nitrospirillum amazonense]
MSPVAVRFAPSPTGRLHIGNARAAVMNWLFARKQGGSFMLRMDDTDRERSTAEYAAGIEEDLRWLGLEWDRYARQSDRLDRYTAAAERLKAAGRLYPCYETPDELGLKRKAQLAQHRPPLYDRAALRLTDADRARLEGEGRRPHWRLKLDHTPVAWDDLVRGPQRFQGQDLSDPVLIREDGQPLYTFASVVDDIELGITHVIRGEDHVANTAVQIQLCEALGGPVPAFGHFPLITDASGAGLSKRLGSLSLKSLREESGLEPLSILSLLAKIGTSDAVEARGTLDDLVADFDLAKVGRGTPKFDAEDLHRLNAQILHHMPYTAVADRLPALGMPGADEAFWLAVRPNITHVAEAKGWWDITHAPLTPVVTDAAFLEAAAGLLPVAPWGPDTWGQWVEAVKAATGAKGKALFMPLRLALTGLEHGPELKTLLPLIGRERALARLSGQTA